MNLRKGVLDMRKHFLRSLAGFMAASMVLASVPAWAEKAGYDAAAEGSEVLGDSADAGLESNAQAAFDVAADDAFEDGAEDFSIEEADLLASEGELTEFETDADDLSAVADAAESLEQDLTEGAAGTELDEIGEELLEEVDFKADGTGETITIVLDPNGGSVRSDYEWIREPSSTGEGTLTWIMTPGDIFDAVDGAFVRDGFKIDYWTGSDGNQYDFDDGREFTYDITLTAHWAETIDITFHEYTGSAPSGEGSEEIYTETVLKGSTLGNIYNRLTSTETLAFAGWTLDASSDEILPDSYVFNGNTDLYPVWKEGYTVTFDINGGTVRPGNVTSFQRTFLPGATLRRYSIIKPYRVRTGPNGELFGGWTTQKDDASTAIEGPDGSPDFPITSNMTLYALWLDGCRITLHGNGAKVYDESTGENADSAVVLLTEGKYLADEAEPLFEYYTAYPGGSTFLGFSTSPDRKDLVFNWKDIDMPISSSSYKITGDTDLYAIWVPGHTITFNANGKKLRPASYSMSRYNEITDYWPEGEKASDYLENESMIPDELADSFKGWSLTADGASLVDFDQYEVSENATFYAVWNDTAADDPGQDTKPDTKPAPAQTAEPAAAAPAPVLMLNVSGKTVPLKKGQKLTKIKAATLGDGDTIVSWTSSNPKVVTVSASGVLKAKKKTGTAVITAKTAAGATATFKVKVQKTAVKTKSVKVTPSKLDLQKGQKETITVEVNPISTKDKVTFRSSNAKVAAVSKKGVVTAKKPGKAVITIKCGSKTKKVKVKVSK